MSSCPKHNITHFTVNYIPQHPDIVCTCSFKGAKQTDLLRDDQCMCEYVKSTSTVGDPVGDPVGDKVRQLFNNIVMWRKKLTEYTEDHANYKGEIFEEYRQRLSQAIHSFMDATERDEYIPLYLSKDEFTWADYLVMKRSRDIARHRPRTP